MQAWCKSKCTDLSYNSQTDSSATSVRTAQDPCLSLAFDYAEHDLYEMLRHHRDKLHAPMDGATVKSVMWQLLNGLSYMEQNWLIHRDLKPSNILVMGDGEEQASLASDLASHLARDVQVGVHVPKRAAHCEAISVADASCKPVVVFCT